MELISFIDLTLTNSILLFIIGFIGGMVSGFIGSGGAFVLTPAMMALGVPGIVAVASNICHKFPKALVGALKRNKYGHVDWKLGIIIGIFAEAGMYVGKHAMTEIRANYGDVGTDLYVSIIFIIVLAITGSYVLRDAYYMRRASREGRPIAHKPTRLAQWVHSVRIPWTMVHFWSTNGSVSLFFIAPIGFATGMLAATIAVGGFIGVPAMMYILGVPVLIASATELVIAFVMGSVGTLLYALEGLVDVRLAMIILAGSLFGIQIGSIGTTYVKDYTVKIIMGLIMSIVLFSRAFYIPGYLSKIGVINPLAQETITFLKYTGDSILGLALLVGGTGVVVAIARGIHEHKKTAAFETQPTLAD